MQIKTILEQINRAFAIKAAALLLFVGLASSCSDSGCIDADDFGEYESQTIEVLTNATQESCTYDYSKDITDTTQGSGIKECLTAGSVTISDETGTSQTNNSDGCIGFSNAKFRNLCISNCIQLCSSNSSGTSASAEPNWVSTDKKISGKNTGVTIRPGSQIIVRAVGNISLGDAVKYSDVYVQANNPSPHSKNSTWNDVFFDVRANQSIFAKFSGLWSDGIDDTEAAEVVGGGANAIGGANDFRTYNGSRRLISYLIPHPTGYDFDKSRATEKEGAKTVPLLPDAGAWQCSYSGADSEQSSCGNAVNGYTNIGYANVDDGLTATTFPVNSNYASTIIGSYGGIIRWDNDGLKDNIYDAFQTANVTCNGSNGTCANVNSVPNDLGFILGDLSSGLEFQNSTSNPVKVSLRSLVPNDCNITLSRIDVMSGTNVLKTFDNVNVPFLVPGNPSFSTEHITLEPNQKLSFAQNATSSNGGINCGRLIGVRFAKYHEIRFEKSGFVKFTTLRGTDNVPPCSLKARIINPTISGRGNDADLYEYNDFSTIPTAPDETDPLTNLAVNTSPAIGTLNWSNKVFVRKGQKIRFSPESWNGTWSSTAGPRKCGIGMAMIIEPRPAILCRGKATDTVDNPLCVPNNDNSGNLTGCQSMASECNQTDPTTSYCPVACQKPITCSTAGTAANNFQKSGCSAGAKPAGCTYPLNNLFSEATCSSCADFMLTAASRAAKLNVNGIDQCYDLENYIGKVSNIPNSTSQSKAAVDAFVAANTTKGLRLLGTFNGDYGNFSNIGNVTSIDTPTGNIVYQLQAPLSFTKAGRLKFLMLDGSDFNNSSSDSQSSYLNNSNSGGSYGGSNGFKLELSGTLEFNNGAWMQVRLCQETNNDNTNPSVACKILNPTPLSNQPTIVEITPPTIATPAGASPVLTGNYKFDDYGNLLRITSPGVAGDCTVANSGVDTISGGLFYCHSYRYFSTAQLRAKSQNEKDIIASDIQRLRLSFKILDPEIGNCTIISANDGITLSNPFYEAGTPSNVGATCATNETPGNASTQSPGTCKKQFYCGNKYSNNSGKYYVNVKVKNPADGNISSIIGSVIKPVVEVMDGAKDDPITANIDETSVGQAERVYKLLISDPRYKAILTMALVTMFTFYGFGYLIGAVEMNHADIINRIIKIGLIYLFVGETGWYWFNKIVVKFFKDSTDYLAFMMASSFDDSPELSNAIAQGNYYDKSILFSSVDKVFSLFFSSAVQKKVSALLFASIFGWAYLIILYSSFMLYVYAVANAVLLYLTAQVFISILFVLGPIFFVLTLFSQTKEMFDNWLKQLISFSLQQIFLLTTLAFFNMMMYEVIKMSLGYKICWDEVWTINIITRITLLSFWSIASLPPRTNAQSEVGNIGNPDGIPSLFSILFIWVIASLMEKFIGFMTDLAAGISGGLKASELGNGVTAFAKQMKKMAGKGAGQFFEKTGAANAVRKLDKALFDSGKLAEEARTKARKQNAADLQNKSSMTKSGDKAVSDYKKKNAKDLIGLSAEEQRKKLNGIRDSAMTVQGKKLGLNEDQIKDLKADKGLKYVDANLFGMVGQALKQKSLAGGSLTKSIGDKDAKTKFTHNEAHDALKGLSAADRGKFTEAVKQGKVEVGKSKIDMLMSKRGIAAVATGGLSEAAIAAKKGVQAAGKFLHDKDFDDAAKQLEDEGKIDRNAIGFSRTTDDKRLIEKRRNENLLQKKIAKKASTSAVHDLEKEANYLNADEALDEKEGVSAISKAASKIKNYFGRGIGRVRDRSFGSNKNETRAGVRSATRKGLDSQLKDASEERLDLVSSLDTSKQELKEATEEMLENNDYKEMIELDKKIKDNTATDAEKSKRNRLERDLKGNEAYVAAAAKAKKATVGIHQATSQLSNVDQKISDLQDFAQAMDSSADIRAAAIEESVEASENDDAKEAFQTLDPHDSDQVDKFVEEYRDAALGGNAASINSQYNSLSSKSDYSSFSSKHK